MDAEWTPTIESRDDKVSEGSARSLHDLLDRPGAEPIAGDRLPILWHWLAFLPRATQSALSQDGHPRTGGFLPPTVGRRRMYAGGKVTVAGQILVEELLFRRSRVTDVTQKSGKSGELLFVTVDHEASTPAGGAIHESNDIVYKDPQAASPAVSASHSLNDAQWTWGRSVPLDPVLLFRFSALTYNAHRIHYDREYATGVEGYPGLVVHGPLQAILAADLVQRTFPGRAIASFAFRSNAPAFDDSPLELRARRNAETAELELGVFTRNGIQTMSARATLV